MTDCNYLSEKNKHKNDKNIITYGKRHIYYIKNSNSKYLSVSNIIDYFFPNIEFNDFKINVKDTKKGGYKKAKTKKILDKKYEIKGYQGKKLHKDIEKYLNRCSVKNNSIDFKHFIDFINNNSDLEIYRTEWLVYSKKYKIVGIVDAIFRNKKNNKFYLYDWKRVKNIYMKPNFFYNYGYYPIDNIPNLNAYHYFLQLNFYKLILKEYNIEIDNMYICQLSPELDNYKTIKSYDMMNEIHQILKYLKKINYILKENDREENFELNFINLFNIFNYK